MVSFLTAGLTGETKDHSECDANRRSKHHVLEQYLTCHVREQARTPAGKRSEYQADESEADKIAG